MIVIHSNKVIKRIIKCAIKDMQGRFYHYGNHIPHQCKYLILYYKTMPENTIKIKMCKLLASKSFFKCNGILLPSDTEQP